MSLEIRRLQNNVWQHTTDSGKTILSRASAKIQDNDFILSNINGQKPIDTFNVSQITLIDETTGTTYPTFTTGQALAIQLKALSYVGFFEEGDVVAGLGDLTDVTITNPSANQIIKRNAANDGWENAASVTPTSNSRFITGGYAIGTDINNGLTPRWIMNDFPFQEDSGADRWVAGSASQERLIHMFSQGVTLNSIEYVNATLSIAGSSTGAGARETKVYAINSASFFPSQTYNTIDANYTLISDTSLLEYVQDHALNRPTIPLSNVPVTVYGLVYDFLRNYQASGRIEMRRLTPKGIW